MRISLFLLLATFSSSAQNFETVKIASKLFNYEVFWGNDISEKHFFSKNNTLYKISKLVAPRTNWSSNLRNRIFKF